MQSALIVDDNKQERDAAADHLQRGGFRVSVAADRVAALAVLDHEAPDVALVSWNAHAADVVRKLRGCADSKHRPWVIALLDRQPASTIPALFEAGVDDFMRRPISREEILARAGAPKRIAAWTGFGVEAERDLRDLKAFKCLGDVVCAEIAQVVGPINVAGGWLVAGELYGASIPMSVVSEHADIRVSIAVEARLARALAANLLGDSSAPKSALDDMLRELANSAGGAVKRAAADEGVTVTTGLPVSEAKGLSRNELTLCWSAEIEGYEGKLGIIGEVHKQTTLNLPASKLQEGMVLTRDLRNESGALVMPAGTRLTATSVERVSHILGARFMVEVTTAA